MTTAHARLDYTDKTRVRKEGNEWRVWIPPRGPQDYENGTPDSAIFAPYGDTFWPTHREACDFVTQVLGNVQMYVLPGQFFVTVDASGEVARVLSMVWSPLASHAGYFGASALLFSKPDGCAELDTEDTDGPLWQGVQQALVEDMPIRWEE